LYMNKKTLAILIIAILTLSAALIGIIRLPKNPTLIIVGTEAPPHTFTKNDTLNGITIELAEKIFPTLGLNYEISLIPWSDAIEKMKNGEADIIMDAIPTEERMKFLILSQKDLYFNDKPN